jgi:geranylgeranyl transferase type-2 subunit beta
LNYLSRQRTVLAANLARGLSENARNRHASFLTAAQAEDGGFSGREGGSDLYYTAFGLWGLFILGALTPEIGRRAADYLRQSWQRPNHLVDFFSLLHGFRLLQEVFPDRADRLRALPEELQDAEADWGDLVTAGLETCRTPDGGYARAPGQNSGSTYATFLTVLCHDELARRLTEAERTIAFLHSRRREDGGFVELAPMRRSGANPTAAAVASLRILQPAVREWAPAVAFLTSLQGGEGGIGANTRVPLADLLSTFTTAWTLYDVGHLDALDGSSALRYVRSLEMPGGGFRAGIWDDRVDVEYTFYGLGALALLSETA